MDLRMPSFSKTSLESRIPAVSVIRNGMELSWIRVSRLSRVVPEMSETMAISRSAKNISFCKNFKGWGEKTGFKKNFLFSFSIFSQFP